MFPEDASLENTLRVIRNLAACAVPRVQIREKDLTARILRDFVREAVRVSGTSTKIIVNDRLDVALAAGAAGVHLGAQSVPVGETVRWCRAGNAPPGFLIGASTHSLEKAQAAEHAGADYVFFGPVFATPSKQQFGPPQGLERLAAVCRTVRIPVLAIGGIALENTGDCFRAGAAGIAAIRLFQEAPDIPALVAALRSQ